MKSVDNLIWDEITDSAKTKFDYLSFEKNFPDPQMADNTLFIIIKGFGDGWSKDKIAMHLFNHILIAGNKIEVEELKKEIEGKDDLFKVEILASQIASDMLDKGSNAIAVHSSICQLLN